MAKRVVKGKAFNIGPGMVLFKGKNPNKTDDIDVGPNNPKEGITVDDNEIGRGFIASKDGKSVTPISDTIQILSNQPMLGGMSPTQLLYGGMSFDEAFAIQEQYKDIYGINDDGSKARFGKIVDGDVPTEEEYITHKIDSIRSVALNKSRTRTTPKVPYGFKEDQIKYANYAKQRAISNRNYAKILLEKYDNSDSYFNRRRLQLLREASELDKKAENYITGKEKAPGASCIYTATDNYGNKYLVASNQLFAKNPSKYGFTKIKTNKVEPGDIVQDVVYGIPRHAMILDSFNNEGVPLFNYSNGGTEEDSIVKQGQYLGKDLLNDNVANVFRFVGTPADSLLWKSEYQQKYGKKFGGIKKLQKGSNKQTPVKEIDWSGIKTTNDRAYNQEYINYINDSLVNYGYNNNQRAAILANIIEESGGDPFAEGPGGYYGLLQWGSDRYTKTKEKDVYKEIDNQLKYLHGTIGETKDKKSWTYGGKGSGYNSFTDAMAAYNSDDLNKVMHGFTWGYVRPAGKQDSYLNRQKVADQLINIEGFKYGGIYIKPSKRGTFTAAAKQHGMSVQGFASKVLANKENYSSAMVKKANFARNASKWNHLYGGESILINPLGERPNAKYRKQMKNKRNKAERGGIQSIGSYNFSKPFIDQYGNTIGINGMVSKLAVPFVNTGLANPPKITSTGNLTKGSGLSTTAMGAIGAGINTLGALIGAGIQQRAINSLEAPKRQYTLLNPVKLKTKININPQIARMREMQAQIADAARRTSGSSRTAYQKILANHNKLLDSTMDLYGRKENIETELINRDLLNQQQVAHTNATNVMNTVNQNNELNVNNENYNRIATSNNWTTGLNTTAGAWAGPNGFIDRANALRVKAGELYTQAIANPTAARLLYGDIDFTTGANKRKAFNTIYDFLNNNRFA